MSKPPKEIDCIKMKHAIQDKIYEETKNLSWCEKRELFLINIAASPLAEKWRALQVKRDVSVKKAG